MSQSIPVTFESTTFPEILITANPNYASKSEINQVSPAIDSKINVAAFPGSESRFVGELRVKVVANDENSPYTINVLCLVVFTITDEIPAEHRHDFALQAAHTMAFPAIRELILLLTARQPWGQFSVGLSVLSNESDTTNKPVIKARRVTPKKRSKT